MSFKRPPRQSMVDALIERDGLRCTYPDCPHPEEFKEEGRWSVSIDHTVPVSHGRANGWTEEEIWDLSNTTLMHVICNSNKSDRLYDENGVLAPKPSDLRPLHQRRADKSSRVPVCETCMSGRLLLEGEVCYDCGSGPQPSTLPRYLQVPPKECSHGWGLNPEKSCWRCFLGFVERRPAIETVMDVDSLQ